MIMKEEGDKDFQDTVKRDKEEETDETLKILMSLIHMNDTSGFSPDLCKELYTHGSLRDENERGLVKFCISIRRVYHGDNILDYIAAQATDVLKTDDVSLPSNSYLASVLRSNNLGRASEGERLINKGVFLNMVVTICRNMARMGLIPTSEDLEDMIKMQDVLANILIAREMREAGFNAIPCGLHELAEIVNKHCK